MRSAPSNCEVDLVAAEVGLGDRDAEAEVLAAAGPDRDAAHDLDAAGHGDVDGAAGDQRGGQVGGLLGGAALGVDRGGGDRLGQAGGQPGGAADVEGLLADLGDAAADDLADLGGVDAGALDQRLLDDAEQIARVHGGQAAATTAHGRPDGIDDHDVGHGAQCTTGLDRAVKVVSGGVGVLVAGFGPALGLGAGDGVGQDGASLGHALAAGFPAAGVEVERLPPGGGCEEAGLCCHAPIFPRGSDSYGRDGTCQRV